MYLHVEVTPNAIKQSVTTDESGVICMSVREPAENNLANLRVLAILHKMYPDKPARIIKGHHSRRKTVLIGNPND